ncbi:hypothetical protein [Olivibacter jilunii]|uniref:hypothetical protein n=1 Tax=Olivibacter jilunii TaxID=985016 RepID=UPI003F1575DF
MLDHKEPNNQGSTSFAKDLGPSLKSCGAALPFNPLLRFSHDFFALAILNLFNAHAVRPFFPTHGSPLAKPFRSA